MENKFEKCIAQMTVQEVSEVFGVNPPAHKCDYGQVSGDDLEDIEAGAELGDLMLIPRNGEDVSTLESEFSTKPNYLGKVADTFDENIFYFYFSKLKK